jgi:preprotein translocase subunit SecG
MLYGLLIAMFVFVCFLLILVVLMQQSKGGMGLGSLSGSAQMIFGGSGGQDILQKITWVLVVIFMFGSLALALMRSSQRHTSRYVTQHQPIEDYTHSSSAMPTQETPDNNA